MLKQLWELTSTQLSEITLHRYWMCLAGRNQARETLEAIQEEYRRRGTGQAFRNAARPVVDTVLAALTRIRKSGEFKNKRSLQKLLRILVIETLRTGAPVKQLLLIKRLRREVNITGSGQVPTEIRRLRNTLGAYYHGSGLGDPLRVQISRGPYIAIIARMFLADVPDVLNDESLDVGSDIQLIPLNSLPGISVFPAFSPTGDRVAFSWNHDSGRYTFDIFVQSLNEPTPLQVTSSQSAADISPTWSPDGNEIAFLRVSFGRTELFVVPAALPGPERKVADLFPIRYDVLGRQLAWYPNGCALAVVDKVTAGEPFAIFRFVLETEKLERITEPPPGIVGDSDPTFSPDGNALVFVRTEATGVKDVFLHPTAGRDLVRLTFERKHVWGLCWDPNRSGLVVSSARQGFPGLWCVGLAGEPLERLPRIDDRALYPALSAGGEHLAYTNLVLSTSIWEATLPESTPSVPPIKLIYSTRNDVNPDISADGSQIAFASDRSGTFEIWVCDRRGANPQKVTSFGSPAGAGSPRWSPNGRHIAFDCRAAGSGHIYVAVVENGHVRRLTDGSSDNILPVWSNDGAHVYFSSNGTGRHEIWRIPSTGGNAIQVTRFGGLSSSESHDGRFLYYTQSLSEPGLWRIRSGGGEETLILPALRAVCWGLWAIADNGVFFLDTPSGGPPPCTVNFLDFRTGRISILSTLNDLNVIYYQGLAIDPNHQSVLYPRLDQSAGEIMISRQPAANRDI